MRLTDGDVVGEKHHVHLGALGGLRQFDIVLKVDAGIGLRLGMTPGGDVVAGRVEEGPEPELFSWLPHCRRSRSRGWTYLAMSACSAEEWHDNFG
jgi:hypothetical protein